MIEFVIFVICFIGVGIAAMYLAWQCSKQDEVIVELLDKIGEWEDRYLSAQDELIDARAKINFYRNELEEMKNDK